MLSWKRLSVIGLTLSLFSCTNQGHAPGGSSIAMTEVTSSVSGASFTGLGVHPQATSGQLLNSNSCSTCGSGVFMNAWSLGSMFVLQGKLADADSCMVAAVAANEIVPGLTSGEFKYIDQGDSQMKVRVVLSGDEVETYENFTCYQGSFMQYVKMTKVGSTATYTFRSNGGQAGLFVTMDASGTVSGDSWTSKTLTVGFYSSTNYSFFTMTQGTDYLDINGGIDSGTLGTLDGTDVRLVSRTQLLGSSAQTYAMGDGSIRYASGVGSAANTNWNGDTGTVGAGPTTYDSVVASATLPTIPTTRTTAFTAAETWDCQMSNPVNFQAAAASNSAFVTQAMACVEDFE